MLEIKLPLNTLHGKVVSTQNVFGTEFNSPHIPRPLQINKST